MRRLIMLTVFSALCFCVTSLVQAQARADEAALEKARRVATLLALVDTLPVDHPIAILRRSKGAAPDVVLLRSNATGAQLLVALMTLDLQRDVEGDVAPSDYVIRPVSRAQGVAGAEERHASSIVARLPKSPIVLVPGVGRVPAITVYLPSREMRENGEVRGARRVREQRP